jgi:hypothetical protein
LGSETKRINLVKTVYTLEFIQKEGLTGPQKSRFDPKFGELIVIGHTYVVSEILSKLDQPFGSYNNLVYQNQIGKSEIILRQV